MKKFVMVLALVLLMASSGWAEEEQTPASSPETESMEAAPASEPAAVEPEPVKHGFGHKLLFYIPNRILDVFDFARVRVRVGPGFAIGARLTKPISFLIGGYASIYAGLPGPRLKPTIKWPIGIENYAGLGISMADGASDNKRGPDYSFTEIGYSLHLLLVGVDIGLDVYEVLDLATGFLFIDLRGDDL